MKKFTAIWLIFLPVLCFLPAGTVGSTRGERRCANAECSEPISQAKTLLRYVAPKDGHISFPKGAVVEIYSKQNNGWGVKFGDKIGLAPPTFLKETKMFVASKNLVTVLNDAAPQPIKVETTRDELLDPVLGKTEEMPAGSSFSFPSMAAAENVDGQGPLVTPSSPQYEVVDGTTIWHDPQPAEQVQQPPPPAQLDEKKAEVPAPPAAAPDTSEAAPTALPADSSQAVSSETGTSTETSDTESVVSEAPVDPTPFENFVTAPPFDNSADVPVQIPETSTEASVDFSQEVTTDTPVAATPEALPETTTETDPETTTEQPVEVTEAPDIQPTESGQWSNLFSIFNSGDGTEEASQENESEEEEEEGEEGDEGEEDDGDEGSAYEGSTPSSKPSEGVVAQSEGAAAPPEDMASDVVVENILQPEKTSNATEDLASSFPPIQNDQPAENVRIPRQTDPGEEVTSGEQAMSSEAVGASGEQASGEQLQPAIPPSVLEQPVPIDESVPNVQQANVEPKLEEIENQDADGKQKEDEDKSHVEELKQKQEEEEELKSKQEEEDLKRKQEEDQAEQQQEELKRQEEEAQRVQEELKKQQELKAQEEEKLRQEEENRIALEAEQERQRQNLEFQRRQEEERMRQTNEAIERDRQLALEREREEAERAKQEALERERQALLEKEKEAAITTEGTEQVVTEEAEGNTKPDQDIKTNEELESSSGGMFSWVSSLFGGSESTESVNPEPEVKVDDAQTPYAAQPDFPPQSPAPEHLHQHQHEHPPVWSSAEQTMCSASGPGCGMGDNTQVEMGDSSFLGIQTPSLDVILLRLVATAVALFLGALSFYFLRKKQVDASLVAHINELEKELLVASKEAVILREEVSTVDSAVNSEELNAIQEELETARIVRADLEEQVATLERELEEATETGIELNRLLSETLEASKGKAHAGLAASVERLQQQLDSQRDKVDSLTRSLKSTSAENDTLKSALSESREKVSALEAELAAAAEIANNIRREKEEANVAAAQELQHVQSRLEEALSSKVLEESRLGSELSALKLKHETLRSMVSMKDAEIKALQDTLKGLQSGSTNAEELLDVSKVKAELEHAKEERNSYQVKCQEEEKARKNLEDEFNRTGETITKLKEKADIAEKNREEAETRLAVLSNYFKEKEEQLQKELGLKEAIVAQHQGDESTVVKHLQLLQEEVSSYRAQNESLKKEILDQERDFKGQIATLEKKAHDNWMTARQAERRLEDARQESAQLRNRLTLIEKSNADPSTRLDANGDGGVASPVLMMPLPGLLGDSTPPPMPPFMFSPPPYPPPPFMPPPLAPHPSLGRPPPLGRMSSPPPPLGQFSPPPPPYDRMDRSSRSPSPPPHRYHHRSPPPPQWDLHGPPSGFRPVPKPSPKKPSDHQSRDHKGMHSSGHSNESMDRSREQV